MSTLSNKQAVNLQFDPNMNSHILAHAIVTATLSTHHENKLRLNLKSGNMESFLIIFFLGNVDKGGI